MRVRSHSRNGCDDLSTPRFLSVLFFSDKIRRAPPIAASKWDDCAGYARQKNKFSIASY